MNNTLPYPSSCRHQFRASHFFIRARFPLLGGADGRRGEEGSLGGGASLLHRRLRRRRPVEEERRVPPIPRLQ